MEGLIQSGFQRAFEDTSFHIAKNVSSTIDTLIKPYVGAIQQDLKEGKKISKEVLFDIFKLDKSSSERPEVLNFIERLESFIQEKNHGFANFLLEQLIEKVFTLINDNHHLTMNCMFKHGKYFHLNDQEQAWAYFISPSVIYEAILHDEALTHIFLPGFWEYEDSEEQETSSSTNVVSLPALPGLTNRLSDSDGFSTGLGARLLKLLSSGMRTSFDHKDMIRGLKPNSLRRKHYIQRIIMMRLQDPFWLEHYAKQLIHNFDWKKYFSMTSESLSQFQLPGKYYEFTEGKCKHFSDDESSGDDLLFHKYWCVFQTFFVACQEICLLNDFHHKHLSNSDVIHSSSVYAQWLTLMSENILSLCDPNALLAIDTKRNKVANASRVMALMVFTSLGTSIFSPSIVLAQENDLDSAAYEAQEVLRRKLLFDCFQARCAQDEEANRQRDANDDDDDDWYRKPDINTLKPWFEQLVKYGKIYCLEAFSNLLATTKEDSVFSAVISNIVDKTLPRVEVIASMVTTLLSDLAYSYHLGPLLKTYLSSIEELFIIKDDRGYQRSSIFNCSVNVDYERYDNMIHYIVKSFTFSDGEDDKDKDDDEDKEVEESDDDGDFDGNEDNKEDEEKDDENDPKFGALELLKICMECGADFMRPHEGGLGLPLFCVAADEGCVPVMNFLLSKGENIDTEGGIDDGNDPMYVTGLSLAVKNGDKETVKFLLDHGADPNVDSESPPLLFACQRKAHLVDLGSEFNEEILAMLLNAGANIEKFKHTNYFDEKHIFPEALPLLGLSSKKRKRSKK